MPPLEEVLTPDGTISLTRLVGPIKDVVGYVSTELSDVVFKLFRIDFVDGTSVWCEGEHDCAYVYHWGPNPPATLSDEVLRALYKEQQAQ